MDGSASIQFFYPAKYKKLYFEPRKQSYELQLIQYIEALFMVELLKKININIARS